VGSGDLVKRDTFELLLGIGVLALGIGLLLFTFMNALALAANPGPFLLNQIPGQSQQTQGPSASFSWSSNGFNLSVQDRSSPGSASIVDWAWDFGDSSGTVNGANPPVHVYANPGPYTVTLTVTDSNNRESITFSPVDIVPAQTRSGQSVGDITAQIPNLNFNLGEILIPVGVGLLTVGLYLAMAVIGGMITKAGWNLIRPRPETIRIRLKPKHLQQAMEEDAVSLPSQPQPSGAMPPVPPPPPPQA
jgi:PKD domain